MNCKLSNDYMMAYFDGNLDDIKHAQLKNHLKTCKSCSGEFESLSEVISYLENDDMPEPPQNFEEMVMDKVKLYEATRKKRFDGILIFLYSFVTAVLAILSFVFLVNFKEIDVFGVVSQTVSSFNSFSSALSTFYNIFEVLSNVLVMVTGLLFDVVSTMIKSYFYVFLMLVVSYLAVQKFFGDFTKYGSGGLK